MEQIPTEPVVEPVVPMGPWVSSKSCSSPSCLEAGDRIALVDSMPEAPSSFADSGLAAPPKETHSNEPTLLSPTTRQ